MAKHIEVVGGGVGYPSAPRGTARKLRPVRSVRWLGVVGHGSQYFFICYVLVRRLFVIVCFLLSFDRAAWLTAMEL